MRPRKAILFFVRDERLEGQIKPLPRMWGSGPAYRDVNRGIYSRVALLHGKVDVVLATSGHINSIPADHLLNQFGRSFGERLANAVESTFALGYEQVVVIGNDCPDITPNDILASFRSLDEGASASAAPTHDGGAFLIGLRQDRYHRESFLDLPWQTSHLFQNLCSRLSAAPLPVKRTDYDSWRSVAALHALCRLLGLSLEPVTSVTMPRSFPLQRRRKALTRSFLPAPPYSLS